MSRSTADRRQAQRAGVWAETVSALVLRLKGYRILERNWRTPVGEADIVASKGQTLAFVEVKRRATVEGAIESVSPRQQQRIYRAAEAFLASHPHCANMHVRFDLMAIVPFRWPAHSRAAWGHDNAPSRRD
ncbi:MAG: YraN family protein [Alphaproteobacteria bacterium]